MKLTGIQQEIINQYIDENLIDKTKLVAYIEKHKIIKNEVFRLCSCLPKKHKFSDEAYCGLLDHDYAFAPISRDIFLRRVPILFHCPQKKESGAHMSGLWNVLPTKRGDLNADELEQLYVDLEFMYYTLHLPLDIIFGYASNQVRRERKVKKHESRGLFDFSPPDYSEDEMFGVEGELSAKQVFMWWCHYTRICEKLAWADYTPDCFLTAYNNALEAVGEAPIIHKPLAQFGVQYFARRGNIFTCKGNFPRDENGTPILRWTAIRVRNASSIRYSGVKSQAGTLEIEIRPDTTIYLLGSDNYEDPEDAWRDDEWHQIYAGPLNMQFNYKALKAIRTERGMTQKEVAEAVGSNVRTYQKWESGTSTPDGDFILRIMNWLQIENVQDLIYYQVPTKTEDS